MKFYVVIPSRYAAVRLPGKPLCLLDGVPMIVRVLRQAQASGAVGVGVATDDLRIAEVVTAAGGQVCMTPPELPSGTDRVCAAAEALAWDADTVVVNLQGDEPFMPAVLLTQVATLLVTSGCAAATLCTPILTGEELLAPQIVKVVRDQHDRALYFSRAPIPCRRDTPYQSGETLLPGQYFRHLGLYAYRYGMLRQFVSWPQAPLERIEQLEQLRLLWQGHTIAVAEACAPNAPGVDTPADLARAEQALRQGAR